MALLFSVQYLPPLKQKDTVESCSTRDPVLSLDYFFFRTAEHPVVTAQVWSFTLDIFLLNLGGFLVGVFGWFFFSS